MTYRVGERAPGKNSADIHQINGIKLIMLSLAGRGGDRDSSFNLNYDSGTLKALCVFIGAPIFLRDSIL